MVVGSIVDANLMFMTKLLAVALLVGSTIMEVARFCEEPNFGLCTKETLNI
jgi:hypothetical protein